MFSKVHKCVYLESKLHREEKDLENERHTFERLSLKRHMYFGKHSIQE